MDEGGGRAAWHSADTHGTDTREATKVEVRGMTMYKVVLFYKYTAIDPEVEVAR